MAEFNPKVDSVGTNNYINYSERYGGNQAWGTLFEGLGKAADQMVQRGLKKEVNAAFAQADADFLGIGVDPTQTGSTPPATTSPTDEQTKPPSPASLPKPLESGLNDVKSLTKAFDAGSFSEKNYWSQVDTRLRQLRSQFPGYNEVIDAYASDAMNSPTANQLRGAIIREMEGQRTAVQKAINEDYDVIGKHLNVLTDAERAAYANRSLTEEDRFRLKMKATQEEAHDQEVASLKAEAELRTSDASYMRGQVEDGEKAANKYVYGQVSQLYYKAYTQALGPNGASIKQVEDAIMAAQKDGVTTDQEAINIKNMADPLIQALRANVDMTLNGTNKNGQSWASIMRPEDVKAIREFSEGQITNIQKMIGGDTSMMGWTGQLVTAQRNNAAFRVNQTDGGKVALQLGALNDASGGALTPYLQAKVANMDGAGELGSLSTVTRQIILGEMLEKGTPIADIVQKNAQGDVPPSALTPAVRSAIDNGVKIITDDKVPADQRANVVLSLYGQSGLEFLRQVDERPDKYGKSSRERVFNMMASPDVYAKVKELGKKDPSVLQHYQEFMQNAIPVVFKDSADSLQDAQIWSKYASARFDTNSGQWVVDIDESKFPSPQAARDFLLGGPINYSMPGPVPGRAQGWGDQIELQKVRDMIGSVKRLNGLMLNMKPILDDMGVKNQPEVLLQALGGVNLNVEKRQPTLDWLKEMVTKALTTGRDLGQKAATAPSQEELDAVAPVSGPGQPEENPQDFQLTGLGMVNPQVDSSISFADHMAKTDHVYDKEVGGSKEFNQKTPLLMSKLMTDPALGGLTKEQAAGIVGNLAHESAGLNPKIKGDSGAAHGWAQWNGPRQIDMIRWSQANGLDPNTDDANYKYLIHDLTNNYPKVLEKIKKAKTMREAAKIFMDEYERPGVPIFGSRLKYGEQALAAVK